jgi:hypothetical protein
MKYFAPSPQKGPFAIPVEAPFPVIQNHESLTVVHVLKAPPVRDIRWQFDAGAPAFIHMETDTGLISLHVEHFDTPPGYTLETAIDLLGDGQLGESQTMRYFRVTLFNEVAGQPSSGTLIALPIPAN